MAGCGERDHALHRTGQNLSTSILTRARTPEKAKSRSSMGNFIGPQKQQLGAWQQNAKGCDIGYALAAHSGEGGDDVDACTAAALDAISAFAISNPNGFSQSRRFFRV